MDTKNKIKILLVDDEVDILKVIGTRLERAGYEILFAPGGEQALGILEKEVPDLIILDILMPGMNGLEVCNRIKEQEYISDVPIIFFSAKGSVDDKILGLKKNVSDYITKPVDYQELLARIELILRTSKRYEEASLKDKLTGLYNCNFFDKKLVHSFDLAKRYERIFSLLVVDLDGFKNVNDVYGHLFGNFVLKKVGEKLRTNLRKVDLVFRYGGDEFTIILPETSNEKAIKVLEKLRERLGIIRLESKKQTVEVKLSFGLASYSPQIKTKEELFNLADRDMYEQKRAKVR